MDAEPRFEKVQALFAEAIRRAGGTPRQIARWLGARSLREEETFERAVESILAGGGASLRLLEALGEGLRLAPGAVRKAYEADLSERDAWATAPATPVFLDEALYLAVLFRPHPLPAGTTRAEAIGRAHRLAAETGHRVYLRAYRGFAMMVMPDGAEFTMPPDYGARVGGPTGPTLRFETTSPKGDA